MNSQFDYYLKNDIIAVSIEDQNLFLHLSHRQNLYENHLKIPKSWFAGRDILEFGPNGGENSLLLAQFGAQIKFVEPLRMMHAKIQSLFSKFALLDKFEITAETLESFGSHEKYDLVIAEGFLHALEDRKAAIEKLFSHAKHFVLFTYSDCYGYFIESFKRFLFHRILEVNCVDKENWTLVISYADKLFGQIFSTLGTARSFDSWVQDILLNPCGTAESLDDFETIHSYIPSDWRYYSGSPVWDTRHHYHFYKSDTEKRSILDSYRSSLPFIISGNPSEDSICNSDINHIPLLTKKMMDYSSGRSSYEEVLKVANHTTEWCPLNDAQAIIAFLNLESTQRAISSYLNSEISKIWGMPQQYVCFAQR